jgi:sulfate transport system ATP-binding protein
MSIIVKKICKYYSDFIALEDINLEIAKGELVALLGPSGSGKTTLLRIIAGLDFACNGDVYTDGENVNSKSVRERKIGFVFQNYALFNHMTVFDNVAFGLKILPKNVRPDSDFIEDKVNELLTLMHLEDFASRMPIQLSGGQKQRVALARALAIEPKILLLDEPFGALDAKVRKELRSWMRRLHNEMNITSIFVTHDQEEAMEVADKIVVMNKGRIEQIGTPTEVYIQPKNSFVYDFLGDFNVFAGWKDDNNIAHITEYEISGQTKGQLKYQPNRLIRSMMSFSVLKNLIPKNYISSFKKSAEPVKPAIKRGTPVQIFARPHEMIVTNKPDDKEYIIVKLVHVNPAGSLIKMELEREGGSFIYAEIAKEQYDSLEAKKGMTLYVRPKETVIFE